MTPRTSRTFFICVALAALTASVDVRAGGKAHLGGFSPTRGVVIGAQSVQVPDATEGNWCVGTDRTSSIREFTDPDGRKVAVSSTDDMAETAYRKYMHTPGGAKALDAIRKRPEQVYIRSGSTLAADIENRERKIDASPRSDVAERMGIGKESAKKSMRAQKTQLHSEFMVLGMTSDTYQKDGQPTVDITLDSVKTDLFNRVFGPENKQDPGQVLSEEVDHALRQLEGKESRSHMSGRESQQQYRKESGQAPSPRLDAEVKEWKEKGEPGFGK